MKLGMQQPYLFPYIGYFQLIRAVDLFVVYDDVQYIKGGWINRNRILLQGKPFMFTLSLKSDSRDSNINERVFSVKYQAEKDQFLKTLRCAYKKAPYFLEVFNLVEEIFSDEEPNLSKMLTSSLKKVCLYLDISTPFLTASEIEKDATLKRENRMFAIFERLGVEHYINAIGGQELYSKLEFQARNIRLDFLQTRSFVYPQFEQEFIPNLSIIDVMMFNSRERLSEILNLYDLV